MTLPSAGPSGRANVESPVAVRTRAPRRGRLPTLSVVVASRGDRHALQTCLTSLLAQCERVRAEIVVARACSTSELNVLSKLYPGVSFVAAPPDTPMADLRALGFSHAGGDIVAITKDEGTADAQWLESIVQRAAGAGDAAPTLAERARSSSIAEWEPYLAAYGIHVARNSDGAGSDGGTAPLPSPPTDQPASRTCSRVIDWARHAQSQPLPEGRAGTRERVLRFAETATTWVASGRTLAAFCADRFTQGRAYARERLATQPATRRWLLLSLTPLMPVALTWHATKLVPGERRREFVRAWHVALVLFSAWVLGEAVGYARGRAGVAPGS